MKINSIMEGIINEIQNKQLIPMNKPYQLIQDNLLKCKLVIEHILNQHYNLNYNVDTSEYFNLIIIRISCNDMDNNYIEYDKICKNFKETFTESGVDVNVSLLAGDVISDNYICSILY